VNHPINNRNNNLNPLKDIMGSFSRNKGKVGERELAHELTRVLGVAARRGVQVRGGTDSPDVVADIPDIHIECKRTERFRLYEALDQAVADAGDKTPIVIHRQNRQPWVAVIRLDDLPTIVNKLSFLIEPSNTTEEQNGKPV
jgi:Holliday junction resolvase